LGTLAQRYAAYGWRAARSHHPGGVNLARADGSIQFTGEGVDLEPWQALATRAGDETPAPQP
jgi:hypothetical protein